MMSQWYENKWKDKADAVYSETAAALQTVYDSLNQGQQNKLMKDEDVKALFERYGAGV